MAWLCFSSENIASMAAPILGDFLFFCSLAASHPLPLAYLLFFSPYLLAALSFLRPLLLSTGFLLLALLTVSPYLRGTHPSPPPPPDDGDSPTADPPGLFGNTLRLVLDMLDPFADGEAGVQLPGALYNDIASEFQACVDSVEEMYKERGEAVASADAGRPRDNDEQVEEEEKRIVVAEAIHSNEIFGWELETISKLYRALTYEVEEFPIKLALRSFKESEFLPPGTGFHGGAFKLKTGDAGEYPRRREAPFQEFESRDHKVPTCDDGEDLDIPQGNASKCAIKNRDRELPGARRAAVVEDSFTGDDSTPLKRAIFKSNAVVRSDSDGSRSGKLLWRSSSMGRAAGCGFSRVASSGDWRMSSNNQALPQALSSSASMRKGKEWKRTLACKLHEERMITDGGEEGMDLLWEAYEIGSGKSGSKVDVDNKHSKNSHNGDKRTKESKGKVAKRGQQEEEEEEEEEEEVGRLCCLQALRFSTAKMSFGMGMSGLLKVSKAMKGVGAFRRPLRSSRKGRERERE